MRVSKIISKMAVIDLQKLFRFGLSGLIASGLHTLVAIMAITMAQLSPATANGLAFLTLSRLHRATRNQELTAGPITFMRTATATAANVFSHKSFQLCR